MAKKPLEIDMIAGSQLRDTQGEMLSVEGADISDLMSGRGRLNDNHGKGFFNSIGRVTFAKKVFKEEDASDDRQKHYWDKVKAPFIYVKGVLYDDEDHPNARAAAAILRNIHKTDTPLQLKASVEGGVIQRGIADQSLLARTKIHSVALTFTPANNNTLIEPISLDKSHFDLEADMLLMKSVMHLAQTNVPSFRHIVRDASATKVHKNMQKIAGMMREAGIEDELYIPSKQHILNRAVEQKIWNNVYKINELVKSLSTEDLDKSLKSKIAGAAIGAAALAGPQAISSPPMPKSQPAQVAQVQVNKPDHQGIYKKVATQYPMLGAIGWKESSGGVNMNHKAVTDKNSPHFGHTAGGMFGMMPNTAAFIIKKDPELAKKYPKLVEAAGDIKNKHKTFTDAFNNDPQAAADFAVSFYKRNKSKTKSPEMLAYSWLNGLKGSWNKYKNEGMDPIHNHPYVKDVMQEYAKRQPASIKHKSNKPLKKALTAGYGGAGAPTSNVAGGVLQSESLEDGRPKLIYLTCDSCGKEQVHAKYQVKCRECEHSLSLEKLYNTLSKR